MQQPPRSFLFRLTVLVLGLVTLILPACMTASGNGTAWKIAALGTDVTGLDLSATGLKAADVKQSPGLSKVADTVKGMWGNYLVSAGMKYLAGQYYGQQGKVTDAATTVKLEQLRNAKSANEAKAALETLKVTTAAEAAAAGAVGI